MSPSHFTKSSLSQTLILFILLGSVFGTSKIFIDGENSKKYIVLITATIWILYLLLTSTFFCTTEKAFRGVHLYIGVLSIGVMESMYGLLQVVGILNTSLNKFSITGSYDTPTGFAIAIALTIPFGIKSYLILNNRLVCGAILLAIITICATIILSKSRTGMLMAASSAFIMLSPSIRIPSIKKTVVLFTLLACIIISLLFVKFNSTYGHFLIWYITLGLIFQRPLIGYGMNGFTAHYMISQADYFRYSDNHVAELLADNVGHPSNEFLKLACEFGILSIIAALALACFIFFCICKYKSRRERPLLFSIYTSLFIASTISYPYYYVFPWCMTVYLLVRTFSRNNAKRSCLKRRCRYVGVVLCILCLCRTLRDAFYMMEWSRTARLSLNGQTEQLLPKYDSLRKGLRYNKYFNYNYASELNIAREYSMSMNILVECQAKLDDYDVRLLKADNYLHLGDTAKALQEYQMASYMIPCRFLPLYYQFDIQRNHKDFMAADIMADKIINKEVKIPSQTIDAIKADVYSYLNNRNLTSGDRN